jgi:membrane-bound metal-dependent hydrolase YbcI (DUF457 family)
MTFFEHALVGVDGAVAAGLHRRFGWPIVALSASMAVLPDWDGLTILLGARCFADAHRVWGHNLPVAGLLAAVLSGLAWRFDLLPKVQQWLMRRHPLTMTVQSPAYPPKRSAGQAFSWMAVGVIAAYSHLLADLVFSANSQLPVWGLQLFWPLSRSSWAYPLVPWGDVGVTLLLVAGMFAMVRWSQWSRAIALCTLGLVLLYIVVRGTCPW